MASLQSAMVILLTTLVCAASANSLQSNCTETEDCINHEACRDGECLCPASHYGGHCEYSVVNAVVITLICVFPPISWIVICCYSIHSKYHAKRTALGVADAMNAEDDFEAQEEIIDDHPPPTYAQVLTFDMTGAYEMVEMRDLRGQAVRDDNPANTRSLPMTVELEPPPSYEEWVLQAERLAQQEVAVDSHNSGSITTIAGNMESIPGPSSETQLADASDLQAIYNINPGFVADSGESVES